MPISYHRDVSAASRTEARSDCLWDLRAQRPVSVERLRGESVVYRPLDEEKAVSPVIGRFPLIQKLIDGIYQKAGISFGV